MTLVLLSASFGIFQACDSSTTDIQPPLGQVPLRPGDGRVLVHYDYCGPVIATPDHVEREPYDLAVLDDTGSVIDRTTFVLPLAYEGSSFAPQTHWIENASNGVPLLFELTERGTGRLAAVGQTAPGAAPRITWRSDLESLGVVCTGSEERPLAVLVPTVDGRAIVALDGTGEPFGSSVPVGHFRRPMLSANETRLIGGSAANEVLIWDPSDGDDSQILIVDLVAEVVRERVPVTFEAEAAAFAFDGGRAHVSEAVAGSQTGAVWTVIDVESGTVASRTPFGSGRRWPGAHLDVDATGTRLVYGGPGQMVVEDLRDGTVDDYPLPVRGQAIFPQWGDAGSVLVGIRLLPPRCEQDEVDLYELDLPSGRWTQLSGYLGQPPTFATGGFCEVTPELVVATGGGFTTALFFIER